MSSVLHILTAKTFIHRAVGLSLFHCVKYLLVVDDVSSVFLVSNPRTTGSSRGLLLTTL